VAPLAAERGVIAYPPAFFADIRPVSAYDMVIRVPGFTFDKGSTVRGLEGSGGNVLIDGHPPLAKNDPLEDILRRIPADSVAHVEVIRGGAPGIDMEGRSVLANVVRKQVAGFRGSVQPYFDAVYDGRFLPGVRFEGLWTLPGGRTAELSQTFSTGHFPNDENGDGDRIRYAPDGRTRLIDSEVDADQHGHRIQTTGAFTAPSWVGCSASTARSSSTTAHWSSMIPTGSQAGSSTRSRRTIGVSTRRACVSAAG
jgi:hypothetical protein